MVEFDSDYDGEFLRKFNVCNQTDDKTKIVKQSQNIKSLYHLSIKCKYKLIVFYNRARSRENGHHIICIKQRRKPARVIA